jgi:hypothetical protein
MRGATPVHEQFDIRKLGFRGSAIWMGGAQSYSIALLEIELTSAKALGDYAIINKRLAVPS